MQLDGRIETPRLVLVSGRGLWCCAQPSYLETLDRSLPNWHQLRDAPLGCAPTPRGAYRHWRKVVQTLQQEEEALFRERMRLMSNAAPRYQVDSLPGWDVDRRLAKRLRDLLYFAEDNVVLIIVMVLALVGVAQWK
ncbi:MAG: hypothetical protein JNM01_05515 [Delftia acidovorans]|nr:hypothetical protein [Delftia acidovorans]